MNEINNLSGAVSALKGIAGVPTARLSDVGRAVRSLLETSGREAFADREALPARLRSLGLSEEDVYRLCLLSAVSGFEDLIDTGEPATQMELDRYAANAASTGLSRSVIMSMMAELTCAAGNTVCVSQLSSLPGPEQADAPAFVIPWRVYADDLRAVKAAFTKWKENGGPLPQDMLDQLWPLVHAGIAEAQYYMGYILLHGDETGGQEADSQEKGVELLTAAADAGNGPAASALGDYYYFKGGSENWGVAYDYYTGFAAPVLSEPQRRAMMDIFNHRRFNRILLQFSALLLAVLLVSVLWAPGAPVFSVMPAAGVAALVLAAALLVFGFIRHQNSPYGNVYYVPTGMFAIWAVYMFLRLVF